MDFDFVCEFDVDGISLFKLFISFLIDGFDIQKIFAFVSKQIISCYIHEPYSFPKFLSSAHDDGSKFLIAIGFDGWINLEGVLINGGDGGFQHNFKVIGEESSLSSRMKSSLG